MFFTQLRTVQNNGHAFWRKVQNKDNIKHKITCSVTLHDLNFENPENKSIFLIQIF